MKRTMLVTLVLLLCSTVLWGQGKRVLFIGDSITDGAWGFNNGKPSKERNHWDWNHIFGHGYMADCASYYMSRRPMKDYEFFNRGISGNVLDDLEARWQEDVVDMKPDVLSILIGTNDAWHYLRDLPQKPGQPFNYEAWDAQYRRLLDRVKEQNPNVLFVLCAPFVEKVGGVGEAADYDLRHQIVCQLSALIKQMAKDYNGIFLPFDKMFDKLVKKEPRNNYWIWDGVHPTPAGHRRMAEMWISKVKL
ncbi:MAG: SGNH/GDSL hydrolase family protein [Bacteroidaceae bacterium]|nr:SGNH/GDSL hydrolase family protein [Bacteroidaceae bacterium]